MRSKTVKRIAMNYYRMLQETEEGSIDTNHIKSMCKRMQEFPIWKKAKLMRWLGFIQGWLWVCGYYTIEEMKRHNRWS